MANIKPRYEVHKLPGTATRTYCNPRKEGGFDYEDKEVDAGFMVYFPNGASIRCWDGDHLKQLGFNEPASLVDMDSGDEVGTISSLKTRSEQKTSSGRKFKPGLNEEEGAST